MGVNARGARPLGDRGQRVADAVRHPGRGARDVVGPRSALEWLIDRYRVRVDKASGIVNDPNDWGLERGEPSYIAELVKRIVTVSVETMRIVRALPPLDEA